MALSELMASVVSGIEIAPPSAAIELAASAFAGAAAVIACAGDAAFALWPITSREIATTDMAGKIKITRPIFIKPTSAFVVGWNHTLAGRTPSCPDCERRTAHVGPALLPATLSTKSKRCSLPLRVAILYYLST